MTLEEAIKRCQKFCNFGDSVVLIDKALDEYQEAMQTILEALEDKDKKIEKLKEYDKMLIKEKQELSSNLLDSIPKEKIEEKMKKVNESHGYSTVNKILIEQVLNELLEDK